MSTHLEASAAHEVILRGAPQACTLSRKRPVAFNAVGSRDQAERGKWGPQNRHGSRGYRCLEPSGETACHVAHQLDGNGPARAALDRVHAGIDEVGLQEGLQQQNGDRQQHATRPLSPGRELRRCRGGHVESRQKLRFAPGLSALVWRCAVVLGALIV